MPRSAAGSPGPHPPPSPFVGRLGELDALVRALPRPGGSGGMALVRGEPGAGKTRLTEELASRARQADVTTIVGRCWDGDAPPYWPWVHALRSLPGAPRTSDLAALVGHDAATAPDRFALFDATAELLSSATVERPLLVVLEDVHDADSDSLLLARFLGLELDRLPVLVVATYRPAQLADQPQLAEHLGELERLATTVDLSGLSVDEVGALLDDPTQAAAVHRRTGGNPLFVLHCRGASPDDGAVALDAAAGLRQAVRAWLAPLGPDAGTALAAAALLGPQAASVERVADLVGARPSEVRDHAAAAARAGLLASGDDPAELRLAHPLLGEVLVADLDPGRRRDWHLAAARLLDDDPRRSGEVANHLVAAGGGHEAEALAALRRTARRATEALAHEEAARQLEAALVLAERLPGDQRVLRCELLLELGASRWRASARPGAEEAFAAATALAIELGDPRAQALAALGGGYESDVTGDRLSRRAERLRDALAALPDTDSGLRSRLLAGLVTNELPSLPQVEAITRADEALAMARRTGDELAIGYALVARQVVELGPRSLPTRLVTCREILSLAHRTGDHGLALQGRFHLVGALLEAGDVTTIDVELAAHRRTIDEVAEPAYARHALWFRTMRLIMAGDAEAAERTAELGLAAAEAASDPDAFQVYGGQLSVIRWLQGREAEMEQLWVDLRRVEPDNPLWIATLAWLWASTGQLDAARGAVETMVDLDRVDQDRHWLLTLTAYAEAVAAVGDRQRAEDLVTRLEPYSERAVPIAAGISWWGTVARPLGLLADALGRPEDAAAHLADARALAGRLGARPWVAQVQLDRAALDVRHDRVTDETRRLVAEATATIAACGPLALAGRADALARAVGGTRATAPEADRARPTVVPLAADTAGPTRASTRPERPRIVVLGAFEVIADDGTTARWTSRKARELLKVLVARRGAPTSREQLMDLLWPGEDPAALANRFSVALSTIRRALDPARARPPQELVAVDGDAVRLRLDNVEVDAEELLDAATAALTSLRVARRSGDELDRAYVDLSRVLALHRGDAIAEEPYAEWAEPLRAEARTAIVAVARELAALAEERGDELLAVSAHRRVLEVDPYDEQAHAGLVRVLEQVGAHGQARLARRDQRAARAHLADG